MRVVVSKSSAIKRNPRGGGGKAGFLAGLKDQLSHLLGHDRIIIPFPSIGSFFPSSCAETPLAAGFKTDTAQIIAARGREIEKFACEKAYCCCARKGKCEHFEPKKNKK